MYYHSGVKCIISVLLIVSNVNADPENGPPIIQPCDQKGVVSYKLVNKNYYLGIHFKANFFEAAEFCRYNGMRLATINSEYENNELYKFMTLFGVENEDLFIGGTDLGHEGKFVWLSNGMPLTYYNFEISQPDDAGGIEDCLEVRKNGQWNDRQCNATRYFVCEF